MVNDSSGDPFAAVPLFASLGREQRSELAASSRVRHYRKGQVLCSEGDPGDDLIVLEEGRVRVCRFSSAGHEIVLADIDAPGTFGELALVDGAPRAATVIAGTDVRVRYLHRQVLLDLVTREPSVAIALMQGMAAMVRATNERLSDILSLDVPGRLAKWLLAHHDADGRILLGQSQEGLARAIGTTRVSVNRTLHQFARQRLIELHDQEIVVRDVPALRALSEG